MKRCRFSFVAGAILVALLAPLVGQAQERPHPNVLFIAVDDLNDWVGPLGGHPMVKTPNIDRLARRGMTFLNAHCQAPLCNPSRTSVMLSLRPTTTGIYALEPSYFAVPQLKDRVPLFEHFKQNGYQVFSVGKLWHGPISPEMRKRQFTELGAAGKMIRPEKPFVETPSKHPLVDWGPFPENEADHYDYQTAGWAIRKLESKPKEPFFLAVGFSLPHVPCYAPQKWFDLYPDDDSILPKVKENDRDDVPFFAWYLHWQLPEPRLKWLKQSDQWRPLVRAYLASVSFMDAQVGRVLDALEASGEAENTIIVLWGDHGWHLGEKDISGKNTLWDRSTRVPLIFAGPGVAKNAHCHRPVELLDLYPTLVQLCGLPVRGGLEGQSLATQLRDPSAPRERPAITSHGPGNHTVRTQEWRYVRYADGSEEMYDIVNDPHEWTNVAKVPKYADLKHTLRLNLPRTSAPPAPGSKSRLIELKNGTVYWETQPIGKDDPIPEE
jgi:arylsulfatase A-like enzyme